MPFLDKLVSPGRDGSLSTSVYRKPTHTDLYLQWGSHHPLSSKYSVIGTLQHRAHTISSNTQFWKRYVDHTFTILQSSTKDEFLEHLNSIQTCICSGGVIILCHLSTVSLGHCSTGHTISSNTQFWKRYVDDTFTNLPSSIKAEFLEHLNSIDQQIQFTVENQREDGAMPFLDILVSPGRDGSLSTSVYRKPTHTDLVSAVGESSSFVI